MSEEFGKIIELICSIPHRLKTKVGGLAICSLVGCLAYNLRFLPHSLAALFYTSIPRGWGSLIWVLFSVIVAAVWWIIWSGRYFPFVGRRRIVAFCIEQKNARIHNYYVQSLDLLRSFIAQCGLSDEIEVRDVGYDLIASDADARKFVMRKGVAAVFHGRLFLDQENGNFIHHYNFRVTWKKPPAISEKIALLLEVDGSLFCSNRDWNIREFDSKNDQQKVAGGFGEIVLFLTVVSQLTDPSSSAANIAILERLSAIIGKATEGVTINLKSGEQVPAEAIPFLRQGRVNALLRDLYLDYGAICIRSADYQTAYRLLHNALKIPSDKSGRISVLVPLALSCYHLGDIKSAKEYSEQISQIDKGNPTSLVNLAFLEIVERNYQSAAAWYRRFIVGQYPHEQLVTQVIEFLGERSKEMPNESALVFAVGAINFAFLDHEQGRTDLEKFVSAVSSDRQYRQMKVLAERLLTRGIEGERKQFKKQQRRKVA